MNSKWIRHLCFIFIINFVVAKEPATNEVAQPVATDLDANLKKALLKALAELENEERTNRNTTQTVQHDNRIFEKASASAVNFIAGPSTTTTTTSTTPAPTAYPVIVQKSDSVQQHTIFSVEPNRDEKEQIQTSASSSFTSSIVDKQTNKKNTVKSTTTTTTLPPPSTEENEAKVEDVQFFSAPLVAAFTVHQDEQGLPRSVVPIYKQNDNFLATSTTIKSQQETITPPPQNKLQFDYLSYQEQQRVLAEQISKLQKQQELYKEYLSKQQQLYQNVQTVSSTNQQYLSGNSVVVQPSYTLTPHHIQTTSFPPNQQQLPNKNAVDFNKKNYFLPLRYNTLVQPSAEVHPVQVSTVSPLPSHTRIFRQELYTGNFLNTPRQVQYQPFRGNFYNVATSPFAFQPPQVNQRLNDLLYRSGIGIGKQQEDLNIVSKVLALNRLRRQGFVDSEKTTAGFL